MSHRSRALGWMTEDDSGSNNSNRIDQSGSNNSNRIDDSGGALPMSAEGTASPRGAGINGTNGTGSSSTAGNASPVIRFHHEGDGDPLPVRELLRIIDTAIVKVKGGIIEG